MKTFSDREVFTATVDEGSLTRAADRLGASLAVCSKRLSTLETRLGVRLLNRTTRSQHLTDEGTVYYEHCLRIQEEVDAVEASLAGMRGRAQGMLRVSTSASFGRKHVSPFVPRFLSENPAIRLQLMMSDSMVDLVADGIDVAIRIGTPADSTLIAAHLAPNRRVLCAAPAYLARAGIPSVPADLRDHQCLILSPLGALSDIWTFGGEHGQRVPVSGSMTSNSGEAVRDAAAGGLGIAIKSIWDVNQELRSGRLVTVLDDYPLTRTDIYALYHDRQFISPKVRAWIDFFKDRYGPVPLWEQGL